MTSLAHVEMYCWQKKHEDIYIEVHIVRPEGAMSVSCCAIYCSNRFSDDSGNGLFVFPVDSKRQKNVGSSYFS